MAFYILVCFGLAIWPATGKIRLGGDGSRPEFSSFSWFSMMFGAGIGVVNVGNSAPRVVKAVQEAVATFTHTNFTTVPYMGYIEVCACVHHWKPL